MADWKIELSYYDVDFDGTNFVKCDLWYATLDCEDGMIINTGKSSDVATGDSDKTGTVFGAIIDATKDLTSKALCSFVKWAWEHNQLPSFYWIHEDTFVACDRVYEIDGDCIREVSDSFNTVKLEDIPFEKVEWGKTHPSIKVAKRMEKLRNRYENLMAAEEAWEQSWVDGPQQ